MSRLHLLADMDPTEPPSIETDPLLIELARTPDSHEAPYFPGTAQYRVVRRLGEGSFGVVYEVQHRGQARRLALKLLKDAGRADWLKREFRSLADITHENLVGLHELVSEDGRWFITMDLIDGVDFLMHVDPPATPKDESDDARKARLARLERALAQLVRGVAAIHAAGHLHRDLKPSNVLVEGRGRLVILDFGLVRPIRPNELLSAELPAAGTPLYMAPELRLGEEATEASDWYSVGVMLEQALGGDVDDESRDPKHRALSTLGRRLRAPNPAERPGSAEILALLGDTSPAPAHPTTRADLFVGRGEPLRVLGERAEDMLAGRAASIFVHGEPGVGKTALCQHFLSTLRAGTGALILPARCYERESVPFKAVDGVVDALAVVLGKMSRTEAAALMPRDVHVLARLFPVLTRVDAIQSVPTRAANVPDAQQLRRRAFAALKELLGRLADRQPVAVFIDDLQWSDLDSARLLTELLGPPEAPALLFIGSYRTGGREDSPALEALLTDPSGSGRAHPEIALDGLSEEDARILAAHLAADLSSAARADAARQAAGHPLFLRELLRTREPARADWSLEEMIRERAARLEDRARCVLEQVALAGRPMPHGLCVEAAGVGAVGPDILRVLSASQLIRTTGPSEHDLVEPFHDRVREAVCAAIDPDDARRHHRSIARCLERANGDPEALAEHFAAAGETDAAGRYAKLAADRASHGLAFDRAATLYRQALTRLTPTGDERTALLESLGEALANAGRGAEAGRVFREAADTARDGRDLRRRAAEQLLVSGREEEGMRVLRPLLDELGIGFPKTTTRAFIRMVFTGIVMSMRGWKFRERDEAEVSRNDLLRLDVLESAGRGLEFHDLWRACVFFNEHTLLSLKVGERRRVLRGLANLVASHAMEKGMTPTAHRVKEFAIDLAKRHDDPEGLQCIYRNLAIGVGYSSGLWREGVEYFERADEILSERCAGNMRDLRYCRMKAALGRLRLGELRELDQHCDAQLREAVDRGDHIARTALQIYAKAPLLLAADEPAAARRMLATSVLPSIGVFRLYHTVTMADAHLYDGDAHAAVAIWRDWWPEYKRAQLGHLPLFKLDATRSYAMALVATGEAAALAKAQKLAKTLKEEHVHGMTASRDAVRGCIAERRGERATAIGLLDAAETGFEAAEMKLLAASCGWAVGVLAGDAAKKQAAEEVMRAEGVTRPERFARMHVPS